MPAWICQRREKPDEIDQKVEETIIKDTITPRKGLDESELIEPWEKIKPLFADDNIDDWLSGKYRNSDDPLAGKTAMIIDKKALWH